MKTLEIVTFTNAKGNERKAFASEGCLFSAPASLSDQEITDAFNEGKYHDSGLTNDNGDKIFTYDTNARSYIKVDEKKAYTVQAAPVRVKLNITIKDMA